MATKLIVHIGAGKTGSSSVQATLDANPDVLAARGFHYLGLMLENAVTPARADWQSIPTMTQYLEAEDWEQKFRDITAILKAELDELSNRGIHTAIWSNEALFFQYHATLHAIKELKQAGYEVEVIGYLRRHDAWARSAYLQWGIKHKTYTGPIKTYSQWRENFHVAFAKYVDVWQLHLSDVFNLRNFEEVGNVVTDFLEQVGLPELDPVRMNETPTTEMLMAWAVFNGRREEPVLPQEFGRILSAAKISETGADRVPSYDEMMPNTDELAQLLEDRRGDIAKINEAFAANGQPEFTLDAKPRKSIETDPWEMDQILLKLVFHMRDRIDRLEQRLAKLEKG